MHDIEVQKLADAAKFNGFHLRVLIWCFVIVVCDGYDLAVTGAALPGIMKEMGIDATHAGFMASAALFGMMFGAIILGALADRIGRRWAISICVLLFSAFTAAAAFATDPKTFVIMRFLAGLGIGGAIPNLTAQMTEYAPKSTRGLTVTIMGCGYAVGGVLAAVIGKQFIESYGWQSVFLAAGAPIILIPFILKYMPESLMFLTRPGKEKELEKVMSAIRPDLKFRDFRNFVSSGGSATKSASVKLIFQEGRGFSSLMLWIAFISCLFVLYALSSWLVKLLSLGGYNLGSALSFLIWYNGGAIIGAIFGGWLADKFSIKWVAFFFFVMAAVALTLLGMGVEPLWLVVACVGASTLGTQILLYAYAGQFYPISIRSTGVGFASGIGRFGGIASPISIGFLVSMKLPMISNFMIIASAAAIGAFAIMCIRKNITSEDGLGALDVAATLQKNQGTRGA